MEIGRVLRGRVGAGEEGAARADTAPEAAALYEAHAGPLSRYLVTVLGDAEEAEDALQETFLGLLRRPRQIPVDGPRAYLFRAAHNQAIGVLRRRRGRTEGLSETWIDPASCEGEAREFAVDFSRALLRLPPDQRAVVALKLGEDLTFREIAAVLDIPANTASSRYRLALARLRTMLEGDDHEG